MLDICSRYCSWHCILGLAVLTLLESLPFPPTRRPRGLNSQAGHAVPK